ncbi:MAG: hypothetical protein QM690_19620, partial [Sphingobium sp.]
PGGGRGGGRGGAGGPGGGGMSRYADPSGVISAEMAVNRLSIEKGEWAALARSGAKDAILLVPEPVFAQRWLKGRRAPALSVRWQTRQVFMSCDGGEAITTGTWAGSDGRRGWYSTIWRRDPKQGFQWVLSHGGQGGKDAADTDEISARVAQCKRRERPQGGGDGPPAGAPGGKGGKGRGGPDPAAMLDIRQPVPMNWEDRSQDGSLRWRWAVAPDKSRTLDVWMATEEGEARVVADHVPPPSGP